MLTCNVMGDPAPSIVWTRENHSTPLKPPKFQLSNNHRSLIIMNATLKERGTYICYAKNKYANDSRNVTVNLEGIILLRFSLSFPMHEVFFVSSLVILIFIVFFMSSRSV